MTDLTEQWKKGELKGEYYIATTNGKIYIVEFQNSISVKKKKLSKVKSFKGYVYKKTVKEVLAPVPSYEEWRRTFHYAGKYEHEYTSCVMEYENLKQENAKLKELLSKCLDELAEFNNSYYPETQELFSQITNAIGEK